MLKLSMLLSILSAVTSVVSFVNQIMIARIFGAGALLDEYLVAVSIPMMVIAVAAGLFSYSIIPVMVRRRASAPRDYGHYCGLLFLVTALLSVIIPSVAYLLVGRLIQAQAPALNGERLAETIRMARISWATFGFVLLVNFFVAVQNAAHRFVIPVVVNVLPYVFMLVGMGMFSGRLGIYSLPCGTLAGYMCALPILYLSTSSEMRVDLASVALWRELLPIAANMPLVLVSLLCFTAIGAIDAFWGARLGTGAVSYLGYSQRILVGVGGLIIVGPSAILSPLLAEASVAGDHVRFMEVLSRAVRMVLSIAAPVALALALLCVPTVSLLFQRGAFEAAATQGLAGVLPGLLCGMVGMVCVVILMTALHAAGDVRGAAGVGALSALSYFLLSGLWSRAYGISGIVAAYCACEWMTFAGAALRIARGDAARLQDLLGGRFVLGLGTSLLVAAVLMEGSRHILIRPLLEVGAASLFARLAASAAIGATGYLLVSGVCFRMTELLSLMSLVPGASFLAAEWRT